MAITINIDDHEPFEYIVPGWDMKTKRLKNKVCKIAEVNKDLIINPYDPNATLEEIDILPGDTVYFPPNIKAVNKNLFNEKYGIDFDYYDWLEKRDYSDAHLLVAGYDQHELLLYPYIEHHPTLLEKFIELGVDINVKHMGEPIIISYLCDECKLDEAELFIKAGANVNAQSKDDGFTILMCLVNPDIRANEDKVIELIKLVIESRADLEIKSEYGYTAIHVLILEISERCSSYREEDLGWNRSKDEVIKLATTIFKLLIEAGANIYTTNKEGFNLLHSSRRNYDIEEMLLEEGLDKVINDENDNGERPIDIGTQTDSWLLLYNYGADVYKEGETKKELIERLNKQFKHKPEFVEWLEENEYLDKKT